MFNYYNNFYDLYHIPYSSTLINFILHVLILVYLFALKFILCSSYSSYAVQTEKMYCLQSESIATVKNVDNKRKRSHAMAK